MKRSLLIVAIVILFSVAVHSQKSNEQLSKQLQESKIKLTYDAASGSSKLIGVAENFPDGEVKAAKVMAMNFAVGFFYPGQTLEHPPQQIQLAFWVMSKKPVFAEKHSLTVFVAGDELIIGDSRYVAKPRENMEYLNFNIGRDDLMKIASYSNVRFKLGDFTFAFTRDHMRMLADLLEAADPMSN